MKLNCICFSQNAAVTAGFKELIACLIKEGVSIADAKAGELSASVCIVSEASALLSGIIQDFRQKTVKDIYLVLSPGVTVHCEDAWELLRVGVSDILIWTTPTAIARTVRMRIERRTIVERHLSSKLGSDVVVGRSPAWRDALARIIEIAQFGRNTTLILGESGTGKEVAAKIIHDLDPRKGKRDLVVQDCSTLMPELSGSEFFGHEKGAYTGAHTDRQGAFALAHGGTLFLDEIGELSLQIQAQLLRAIQEGTYKRVGGTAWQHASFRLICATNRDLPAMVDRGAFRADLFHRIAGHVCRLPPLRERLEDVLPLAVAFIEQMCPGTSATLDPMVRDYLLRRDYPGNVRELKQVVGRLVHRCGGEGTISIGLVAPDERLPRGEDPEQWANAGFESVVQRAVILGAGLKEIGRAAEDCAIRCAMAVEDGSVRRAALRLGVTDRALQLRRAQGRAEERAGSSPGSHLAH